VEWPGARAGLSTDVHVLPYPVRRLSRHCCRSRVSRLACTPQTGSPGQSRMPPEVPLSMARADRRQRTSSGAHLGTYAATAIGLGATDRAALRVWVAGSSTPTSRMTLCARVSYGCDSPTITSVGRAFSMLHGYRHLHLSHPLQCRDSLHVCLFPSPCVPRHQLGLLLFYRRSRPASWDHGLHST